MESSFIVLASMLVLFGALGIVEGMILHPAFYSSSIVIFGMLGYFSYRLLRER